MKNWLRKNKINIILVLAVLVVGYWLGQRRSPQPLIPGFGVSELPAGREAALFKTEEVTTPTAGEEPSSPSERLVIKTASLSLLVKEVRESVDRTKKLAAELAGFVVNVNVSVIDEKKGTLQATVTIRVPDEKFDEALNILKKDALKVTSEQTSGQDVTEEYTDLQSRLRNLEATESQLLKIMERAGEIKDVLAVQTELTQVREQIETTKGRIKFLEESAALSSITAYFATEEEELPIVEEHWRPLATAKAALRSLVSFGQTIADKTIFATVFLSPVIAVALMVWFLRRIKKKD